MTFEVQDFDIIIRQNNYNWNYKKIICEHMYAKIWVKEYLFRRKISRKKLFEFMHLKV